MGAAQTVTWCQQSTLSTWRCRHGRLKSKVFASRTIVCLFVCLLFGSCATSNTRQPSGPVPGAAAAVRVRPQACALLPGHVTGGRLDWDWESPLLPAAAITEHQRRRQYLGTDTTCSPPDWGLGPYNQALSWGRWSNFPKMQVTWHHGSTLNLVNRTSH